MKRRKKFWITVGLVAALVGGCAHIAVGVTRKHTDDPAYYRAVAGEIEGHTALPVLGQRVDVPCPFELPILAQLEAEADCRFDYTVYRLGIFESHTYILIADYATGYSEAAAALDGAYSWREEEAFGVEPEFEMDGFCFRAVEGEDDPHQMLFIGTSDATGEIAYIYFYDQDLDQVPQGIVQLLKEDSGWNEVVGK